MIYRYEPEIFFLPSWKEIYKTDDSRKETFAQAQKIEETLKKAYYKQRYLVITLPKLSVDERLTLIETIIQ
jgi:predicted ATPase